MLPAYFIYVAIALRLLAGAFYLRATLSGRAKPSVVSWSFWSLAALMAFAAQISKGAGPEAFVTLTIGLSPLAVCAAALYRGAYKVELSRTDKWCIVLTSIGLGLWMVSSDPIMAILLSIAADVCSMVPTFIKCYRQPHTEYPIAYGISVLSMVVTLLTITDWQPTHWLYPGYIMCSNTALIVAIVLLSRMWGAWDARRRGQLTVSLTGAVDEA